ncbi:hypothetical protein L3Q82_003023 [Scortum barcoo]|uniref:Uncharacterized protein n=1 Tax=Scortum barcoo TaxID=214431 RepID=A0ACB8VQP9_9TELE|nr:hypothetical protein L3Q82_003023 [Scortum barcoo]
MMRKQLACNTAPAALKRRENLDPDPDPDPDQRHPYEEQYVSEGESSQLDTHTVPPDCRDAETITDVCNSTDLPEFEIISLLEEQLPVYRLRADTGRHGNSRRRQRDVQRPSAEQRREEEWG